VLLLVAAALHRRDVRERPGTTREDFHPQAVMASLMTVASYLLFAVAMILYLTLGLYRARAVRPSLPLSAWRPARGGTRGLARASPCCG
jgi:uncharacterized membrane-anchored protein